MNGMQSVKSFRLGSLTTARSVLQRLEILHCHGRNSAPVRSRRRIASPSVVDQEDIDVLKIGPVVGPPLAGLPELKFERDIGVGPLRLREMDHHVHLPLARFSAVALRLVVARVMYPKLT